MKVLSTEQQIELQAVIEAAIEGYSDAAPTVTKADLAYWAIELKPKRVRRKLTITNKGLEIVDQENSIV